MFYSHELLNKKGRFYHVWISATLKGHTSFNRSLNARAISKVKVADVAEELEDIICNGFRSTSIPMQVDDRPVRISLYLSSLLLHGCCMLLDRQASLLFRDLGLIYKNVAEFVWLDEKQTYDKVPRKRIDKEEEDLDPSLREEDDVTGENNIVELMLYHADTGQLPGDDEAPLVFPHSVPNERITLLETTECRRFDTFERQPLPEDHEGLEDNLDALLLSLPAEEESTHPDLVMILEASPIQALHQRESLQVSVPKEISFGHPSMEIEADEHAAHLFEHIPLDVEPVGTEAGIAEGEPMDVQHDIHAAHLFEHIPLDVEPVGTEAGVAEGEPMDVQHDIANGQPEGIILVAPEATGAVPLRQPQETYHYHIPSTPPLEDGDSDLELEPVDPALLPKRGQGKRRMRRLKIDKKTVISHADFKKQIANVKIATRTLKEDRVAEDRYWAQQDVFQRPGKQKLFNNVLVKQLFHPRFWCRQTPEWSLKDKSHSEELQQQRDASTSPAPTHERPTDSIDVSHTVQPSGTSGMLQGTVAERTLDTRPSLPGPYEVFGSMPEYEFHPEEQPMETDAPQPEADSDSMVVPPSVFYGKKRKAASYPLPESPKRRRVVPSPPSGSLDLESVQSRGRLVPEKGPLPPQELEQGFHEGIGADIEIPSHPPPEDFAVSSHPPPEDFAVPSHPPPEDIAVPSHPPPEDIAVPSPSPPLDQDHGPEITGPAGEPFSMGTPEHLPEESPASTPLSERWEDKAIAERVLDLCGQQESNTTTFDEVCPPLWTNRRQASKAFLAILNMHKQVAVSQDPTHGEVGPIVIKKRSDDGDNAKNDEGNKKQDEDGDNADDL